MVCTTQMRFSTFELSNYLAVSFSASLQTIILFLTYRIFALFYRLHRKCAQFHFIEMWISYNSSVGHVVSFAILCIDLGFSAVL